MEQETLRNEINHINATLRNMHRDLKSLAALSERVVRVEEKLDNATTQNRRWDLRLVLAAIGVIIGSLGMGGNAAVWLDGQTGAEPPPVIIQTLTREELDALAGGTE